MAATGIFLNWTGVPVESRRRPGGLLCWEDFEIHSAAGLRWSKRKGRITLMVMVTAMVLIRSSAEEEPVRKARSTFFSFITGNGIRHSNDRNGKESDRTIGTWDMKPVIVKLNTMLERYNVTWGAVKELYREVEPCMPDRCGKIHHDKHKMPRRFKCSKFKGRRKLKKKIVKILSKFHVGVQSFSGTFQNLTALLEGCPDRRREILREFKNDFKMLSVEIETLLTKKRLKTVTKRLVEPLPGCPDVAYRKNELMILQSSKKFLFEWKMYLSNVFKCWQRSMKNTKGRAMDQRRPGLVGPLKHVEGPYKQVPFNRQQRPL